MGVISSECSECRKHGPEPSVILCTHYGSHFVRLWYFAEEEGDFEAYVAEGPVTRQELEARKEAHLVFTGDPRIDGAWYARSRQKDALAEYQARCQALMVIEQESTK